MFSFHREQSLVSRYCFPLSKNDGTPRAVARIVQRGGGGGGSHCVTPRVFTRLSCPRCVLLKVTFFRKSSERGGSDKPTK